MLGKGTHTRYNQVALVFIFSIYRAAGEKLCLHKREEVIIVRVRPFFWCLLLFTCFSVLVFAATFRAYAPAILHVHLEQQPPVSDAFTTLYLSLTDQDGLPIEQAQVLPSANMTNMVMVTHQVSVRSLGRGNYLAQLLLYMAGPWEIHIVAYADGFASVQQALFIQVQ